KVDSGSIGKACSFACQLRKEVNARGLTVRDLYVVSDHQRSAREKAKDPIGLRFPFSCTDIVGCIEADPFPLTDFGDAIGDRDSGEGRGLLNSFPIDSLT